MISSWFCFLPLLLYAAHIGDATATEHHHEQQKNVGSILRATYGPEHCYLIGQTTHSGTVRAAKKWAGLDAVATLLDPLPHSLGELLATTADMTQTDQFALLMTVHTGQCVRLTIPYPRYFCFRYAVS